MCIWDVCSVYVAYANVNHPMALRQRSRYGCHQVDDVEQGDPELRPDLLEDQVARAMEAARKRSGLTVEAMARRLRPALRLPDVPPEKQVRNNWYGWRRTP